MSTITSVYIFFQFQCIFIRFDVYMLNFVVCGRFYNFVRGGTPYNDVISQESRDLNFRVFIYAADVFPVVSNTRTNRNK